MSFNVKDRDGNNVTLPNVTGHVFAYALSAITPVATPTDIVRIKASTSKTVNVLAIEVTGAATAAGSQIVKVEKHSTLGTTTSATLTAITPCALTGGTVTGSAEVVSAANVDAQGTSAGLVKSGRINMVAIGSAATSGAGETFYCVPPKPISIAKGSAEYVSIGGGGSAVPSGGKWDVTVYVEEV